MAASVVSQLAVHFLVERRVLGGDEVAESDGPSTLVPSTRV